jgi:hemoglobin
MSDRLHDSTTEAAPEAGRRTTRPAPDANAPRSAPGSAGALLAGAALGAFVLVGHAAPAAAQPAPTDEAQAGQVDAATADAGAERLAPAGAERPAGALTEVVIAGDGEPVTRFVGAGQEKSLYERLGGLYPIASVVDVFIDLLLHNDVLNENPAIRKARDEVPAPGLKYHVTAMVCQATGGPCEYTGRSMKAAHAHLNIGEREWKAMLSDLRRTLNDFQVPEQEQEELVAIVQSTKDDIVVED